MSIDATLRPWLRHYPANMPANINPDLSPNLVTVIESAFDNYRYKAAFSCMGKELTYDDLDRMSRNFAAYLHSRGLEPGDRVAIMMPNILQYPVVLFALLRAGLVIVNTNPLYTPREMKHQFNDSGAKAIIIVENFAHNLEQILPETGIKTIIVASMGEMLGAMKGTMVNFVVRHVKKLVPDYNLPNIVSVKHALKEGAKFQVKPHQSKPDDVVAFQYTGGTTGVSKGAMLTNRNLIANMEQMKALMLTRLSDDGSEVAFCPLPLYHIFAFTVNCMGLFSIGCKNILIPNPRDFKSVVSQMKANPPTAFIGINTLFNGLTNNEDFQKLDFSRLKIAVGGGMAVQRAVAENWQKLTGCYLAEGYGMTETAPCASCNPIDGSGKIGTIGMPLPSTDMRIVDDNGNPVGVGETGEIQIKGPQVMKGYYNRAEATAEVLKDGWMCTGDIGSMDEMGYFKIVDRKKDMILVSGFNVYPNEIEDVVAMHPKVLEVAAIGVQDPKSGEVPKIFIVKKDNSLTEEEILTHCRANLTNYKVPRYVVFKETLPKTNVGKILRRELRDEK
ncbi:MAG: long-chain-fatty-acid--CoA ligase FadD [Bacteroidota bacterium]|jgi:long-chain acyl-CoA synthetase